MDVFSKTVLYQILFARDATLLNKMLRDARPQISAMLPDDPMLAADVVQAIDAVITTKDLCLKKIIIVWITAQCTPMQNFVCAGDPAVGMFAEPNKKANEFFQVATTFVMEDIPQRAGPHSSVVAFDLMHLYMEA
jgi:hypothetical protein